MPSFERNERDRGLHRVTSITSATLIGGLALSGGFAVVAAHVYSGSKKPAATVQIDETATTGTDAAPPPSEPVVTADAATTQQREDHSGEDPGGGQPAGDDDGRVNGAPQNRPAPVTSTIATAGPSATPTTRPTTVVTTPKRTRPTKPPVSGGS